MGEGDSGGPSIRNTLLDFQNEMRVPSVSEIVQTFLPFMILFMTYKLFFIHVNRTLLISRKSRKLETKCPQYKEILA